MAMKQLRRMDTAGFPDDFALPRSRYGFGVSWDSVPGRPAVDVDLQCVVVDNRGKIIDCAYYNNLKAVRSITHSGDEATGIASGIDEQVWVNIPKLPDSVAALVFVIAAHSGGNLRDVANGKLHILEENARNEIARWDMEQSDGSVDVVGAMFRSGSGWSLRIIDEPAQQGRHFMDILPLLANVIRVFIPNAPQRQKVAFAMEKGTVLDLPQDLNSITIGLGWDTHGGEVDLDVSAVLLDSKGDEVETIFFGSLESQEHGIQHSGDNLTGEGDGDDEQIRVNLGSVGLHVTQIVFVINVYTQRVTFQQVANPYCRVVDNSTGSELCRYCLSEAGSESGLVVSKIARDDDGRWSFHALGLPCRGRTYKDSLPEIKQICVQDTRKLMARGGTADFDSVQMPCGTGFKGATPAATQLTQPTSVTYMTDSVAETSGTYRLGQAVSILRSSGSWSVGTIKGLQHGLVTVNLQDGSEKQISVDALHSHMRPLLPSLSPQPQAQSVLVLRSDGSWSPGKIVEVKHGFVTIALQGGDFKHIPAEAMHTQVRILQTTQGYGHFATEALMGQLFPQSMSFAEESLAIS